jgi:hypothetical protein
MFVVVNENAFDLMSPPPEPPPPEPLALAPGANTANERSRTTGIVPASFQRIDASSKLVAAGWPYMEEPPPARPAGS